MVCIIGTMPWKVIIRIPTPLTKNALKQKQRPLGQKKRPVRPLISSRIFRLMLRANECITYRSSATQHGSDLDFDHSTHMDSPLYWLLMHDSLLVFHSRIWHIPCFLMRSERPLLWLFKVIQFKNDGATELWIHNFLFNSNIWPNSAPLHDIKPQNLTDLAFPLKVTEGLMWWCHLTLLAYGFLLFFNINIGTNSATLRDIRPRDVRDPDFYHSWSNVNVPLNSPYMSICAH